MIIYCLRFAVTVKFVFISVEMTDYNTPLLAVGGDQLEVCSFPVCSAKIYSASITRLSLFSVYLVEITDLVLILCANMMCYVNTRSEST